MVLSRTRTRKSSIEANSVLPAVRVGNTGLFGISPNCLKRDSDCRDENWSPECSPVDNRHIRVCSILTPLNVPSCNRGGFSGRETELGSPGTTITQIASPSSKRLVPDFIWCGNGKPCYFSLLHRRYTDTGIGEPASHAVLKGKIA